MFGWALEGISELIFLADFVLLKLLTGLVESSTFSNVSFSSAQIDPDSEPASKIYIWQF